MPRSHDETSEHECSVPEYLDGEPAFAPMAAAAAAAINTQLMVPTPGLYGTHTPERRFGIAQTIQALLDAGAIWTRRHANGRFGIGDISKNGGGQISGHASHRLGVDVDIRPQRSDEQELPVTINDAKYSRERTQEFIDILYAGPALAVKMIFFNDDRVEGVQHWDNHDNHFHVRFNQPGEAASPPLLALNSRGPAVRELQRRLNFWIAASGSGMAPLQPDGRFQAPTLDAVKAFQTAQSLTVDGRVGPLTWGRLPTNA